MHRPLGKTLQALALTLLGTASAITPAGTVIQNQATLEFTSAGGAPVTLPTPPATTVVGGVCAVGVTPDGTVAAPGQSATLRAGAVTAFSYAVRAQLNSGAVTLGAAVESGSSFQPTVSVHLDRNANGAVDTDEPEVTALPAGGTPEAGVPVLLRVAAPAGAQGTAYVNLVATCPDGTRDSDNVSAVTVQAPPAFTFTKSVAPGMVGPNDEVTVNILATNVGGAASEALTVTDFLNTPDMREFVYVSGSARVEGAGAVAEFSADGLSWSAAEPAPVLAVRASAPTALPGASVRLSFRLRPAAGAAAGVRRNMAALRSGDLSLDAPADITVRYQPEIALGPGRNPQALPGGELSEDDRQVRPSGLLGQEVCFPHTVQNLGDRPDTLTVTGRAVAGEAEVRFTLPGGAPTGGPLVLADLAPQATADFSACYLLRSGGSPEALRAVLTATSARGGTDNSTVDVVLSAVPNTLAPVKAGSAGELRVVEPGTPITYTLTFRNTLSVALNTVVIRDPLNNIAIRDAAGTPVRTGALEFISADAGGVLEGGSVVWRRARVEPGETLTLKVVARVPADTPDGARVVNVYTVGSDELTTPAESNPVQNPVFNPANLSLVKTSTPAEVTPGQDVTYTFTLTNTSDTGYLNTLVIEDVLPEVLTYVEGSSLLGDTPITPTVQGRRYSWTVPGLAPRASVKVSFRATVALNATDGVINSAIAKAVSGGGEVATPPSMVKNVIKALPFGENNADIVGYVFVDVNRNGRYDRAADVPSVGARVILAGGRTALTDVQGRYHFQNVREATAALRLDPASVTTPALQMPQDVGRPGSRLVYVRNLTSVDFPLAPSGGDVAVIRDTTLRVSSARPGAAAVTLTVRKQVFATAEKDVYRVQLTLSNGPDLTAVRVMDPLPDGAALVDGQNDLSYDTLPGGERVVTYRFRWTGDPKAAVTDPSASWRY